MNNVILGKTIKAMYKLSGKTLTQLSDETGLTVDTINNLFYARIQKPGLLGVNTLVGAMGFSVGQLMDFLEKNRDLTEESDVTELFTAYINGAADTNDSAAPAKITVSHTKGNVSGSKGNVSEEIELLNAEHEKQLDRFRATHQHYVEQLQEQHDRQIVQMEQQSRQTEQHFAESISALQAAHAHETERLEKDTAQARKNSRWLSIALGIETAAILIMLFLDMFNRSAGWLR